MWQDDTEQKMPNVPPLDPNWKAKEDPMNPPLSPNWKPSTPLRTTPPEGYTPAYGSSRSSGGGSTQVPSASNGGITDGYYTGTGIKAYNPEESNLFRRETQNQQQQPQAPAQTPQQPRGPFGPQNQQPPQAPNYQPGMAPGGPLPAPTMDTGMMADSYRSMKPSMLAPQGTSPNEAYQSAREQLSKAAMNVARDPRFSPEQKAAAFERIKSRADELDQGFQQGRELMTSPYGFDAPPPEVFGEMQPVGLQPVGQGALRNPETGDILNTVRASNGQIIPANLTQSQIDSLPDGTRYLTSEGKMEVANGSTKTTSSRSGSSSQSQGQDQITPEDAYKQYEKWSKGNMAMTTSEELKVKDTILSHLDESQKQQAEAELAANPDGATQILSKYSDGMDVGSALENARISAFTKDFKASKDRSARIAKELGIAPPEQKQPAINPKHYVIQQGSRGTTRIYRRGSSLEQGIPAMQGPDGELRPAPTNPRELADLEVNTDFVNIKPAANGMESRVLPFSKQMINLGNFAMNDQNRAILAKEMSAIQPRSKQDWDQFSSGLQQFGVVDERWDPKNLTPAQQRLQSMVSNFYRELQPEGRALMTMYIAHALGHRIDPTRTFTSTGWARTGVPQGGTQAQVPASPQAPISEGSPQNAPSENRAPATQDVRKSDGTFALPVRDYEERARRMTPEQRLAQYEANRDRMANATNAEHEALNMRDERKALFKKDRQRQFEAQQNRETEQFNAEQWAKLHAPDRKFDAEQDLRQQNRNEQDRRAEQFAKENERALASSKEQYSAPERQREALYARQHDERRRIQEEMDKIESSKPGFVQGWTGMPMGEQKRLIAEADAKIAELRKKFENVHNYVK